MAINNEAQSDVTYNGNSSRTVVTAMRQDAGCRPRVLQTGPVPAVTLAQCPHTKESEEDADQLFPSLKKAKVEESLILSARFS